VKAGGEYDDGRHGIGLSSCVALVTATMVGTGVYTALGFQLQEIGEGFPILLLWVSGGVISLCGALSYAELAARIPRSGGEYAYLSEIYHPSLGFTAACVSLLAGFAAPIALAAMAFGGYLHAAFPGCPPVLSGFLAVLLITLLHLRSVGTSSLVQNASTALKFLLIVLFVSFGLAQAVHHRGALAVLIPKSDSLLQFFRPSSGVALLFVLYSYSGWNASTYLTGEVRRGGRTVGLSLLIGTLAVTLLYVALNAVFLTSVPLVDLRGVLNVASVSAGHLLGVEGGRVMSAVIATGLLASISAMIWAGPRVTQRVGEDYPVLGFLARRSSSGIPVPAMLFQLALVLSLLIGGSFETVLVFAQIPLLLCLMLGAAGVVVLRMRYGVPGEGLFRCPLHPLPPILFVVCSFAGLLYAAVSRPWIALAGLSLMLVPPVLYRLFLSKSAP
jgi:APA family basic amino acid/polyamine antiporter